MELRSLAQPEHPGLGILRRLEALGGIADDLAVGLHLGEAGADRPPAERPVERIGPGGRVERVGGGAAAHAHLERAALLGLGPGFGKEERLGGSKGQPGGNRQLMEIAARDLSLARQRAPDFQLALLFRHRLLPEVVLP